MPVKNGFMAGFEISNFYKENFIKDYKIAVHSAFWDSEA